MRERSGAERVLVGKPEGKRPLERLGCRWEDKNKMGFQKMGWTARITLMWLKIGTGGWLF